MRDFQCPQCGADLVFENSICLACGTAIGFSLIDRAMKPVGDVFRLCVNSHVAACNWLVSAAAPSGWRCQSCALTRTIPPLDDLAAMANLVTAEQAKRRLVLELSELGLPIVSAQEDPEYGLRFDLLSSRDQAVSTGHMNGVIVIDLAEGDDVHREQLRVAMAEPYRTMLGHFRHEIGHYYFWDLIDRADRRGDIGGGVGSSGLDGSDLVRRFTTLFGDPRSDYAAAAQRHYRQGPPTGWEAKHVSSYASMHPAEDWAESFAHYLHIRDTLDTAAAFAMAPARVTLDSPQSNDSAFAGLISVWLPLSRALNMVNRSMGHDDLYPFVLATPVLEKLSFIHEVVVRR